MILTEDKTRVKVESGGVKSMTMEIDSSNTGILFSILSENLYSDIYGSIIRELVSNAWDANKEAGNGDKPVYVHFNGAVEGEDAHIKIVDCGTGISEDRVEKIYGKYLASSKRDSNDQIGGWGLGSKTPLAYNDYFHISTVHDGMQYLYIMRRGVSNTILELLYSMPTDLKNGTEIKIYLKDPATDMKSFFEAAIDQLAFFDNVLLIPNEAALNLAQGYRNQYKAIDQSNLENFNKKVLYRFKNFVISTDGEYQHPSILLGQVKYKFPKDVDTSSVYGFQLSIKFDIGELPVTPSREGILWTPAALELFKSRYSRAVEEMNSIIAKQKSIPTGFIPFINTSITTRTLKVSDDVSFNLGNEQRDNQFEREYKEINGASISLSSAANCKYFIGTVSNKDVFKNNEFQSVLESLFNIRSQYWEGHSKKLRETKWSRKNVFHLISEPSNDGIADKKYYSFEPNQTKINRDIIVQNLDKFTNNDRTYFFTKKYKELHYFKQAYSRFIEFYNKYGLYFDTKYSCKQLFREIFKEITTSIDTHPKFYDLPYVKVSRTKTNVIAPDSVAYNVTMLDCSYTPSYAETKGNNYDISVFKKMQGIVVKKGELDAFKAFYTQRKADGGNPKHLKVYAIADSKFEKYKHLLKNPMSKEQYNRRLIDICTLYEFFVKKELKHCSSDWVCKFLDTKHYLTDVDDVMNVLESYNHHFGSNGWQGGKPKDLKKGQWRLPHFLEAMCSFYKEKGWLNQDLFRKLEDVDTQLNNLSFTEFIKPEGCDHPVIKTMVTRIMLDSPTTTRKQKINILTQKLKNK